MDGGQGWGWGSGSTKAEEDTQEPGWVVGVQEDFNFFAIFQFFPDIGIYVLTE